MDMDLTSPIAGRYVRIVAIIALLLGLSDAARLLGVAGVPGVSPIYTLGGTGFSEVRVTDGGDDGLMHGLESYFLAGGA